MDSDIFKSFTFYITVYVGVAPAGKKIKRWLLPGGGGKTMAVLIGVGSRQSDGCYQEKTGHKTMSAVSCRRQNDGCSQAEGD